MNEKRFRVNDLVKFNYSEIGKYVDENHTDRPLRNDEVCDLLNKQQVQIKVYEESLIMKSKKISEQQATITVLEKNFEDLVNWSTEISKRNVLLDEKIGRLQQENKELKNKLNKHL